MKKPSEKTDNGKSVKNFGKGVEMANDFGEIFSVYGFLLLLTLPLLGTVYFESVPNESGIGSLALNITFDRLVDCRACGQHKTPPLTDVNMTISAAFSGTLTDVNLTDYFPVEWSVTDSNGGTIESYNTSHNRISWHYDSITESVSQWYIIRSPDLIIPPVDYYFISELAGQQSDPWRVIVADAYTITGVDIQDVRNTYRGDYDDITCRVTMAGSTGAAVTIAVSLQYFNNTNGWINASVSNQLNISQLSTNPQINASAKLNFNMTFNVLAMRTGNGNIFRCNASGDATPHYFISSNSSMTILTPNLQLNLTNTSTASVMADDTNDFNITVNVTTKLGNASSVHAYLQWNSSTSATWTNITTTATDALYADVATPILYTNVENVSIPNTQLYKINAHTAGTYWFRAYSNSSIYDGSFTNTTSAYPLTVQTPPADTTPPNINGWKWNVTNATNYSSTQGYQFNATVTDTTGISYVWVEQNFTGTLVNTTVTSCGTDVYCYNVSSLGANVSYYMKWYANDSSSNHNLNNTDYIHYYQVNKSSPILSVTLNGTAADRSYFNNTVVNIGNATTPGYINSSLNFYLDGVSITSPQAFNVNQYSAKAYTVMMNFSGDQNYTIGNVSVVMTLNDSRIIFNNFSSNVTSLSNYSSTQGYEFNSTAFNSTQVSKVWVRANFSGSFSNYTATSSGGNSWYYDNATLAAGTYIYTWWANDTYLVYYNSSNQTFQVNKSYLPITLYINGTDSDRSLYNNSDANFTANFSSDYTYAISIWDNLSSGSWQSSTGNSPYTLIKSLTFFPAMDGYQIIANFSNANYTYSQSNHTLNLTLYDSDAPSISNFLFNVSNMTNYSSTQGYQFNATISDIGVGISYVWIEQNFTGSLANITVGSCGGAVYCYNTTPLGAGSYQYKWYANDTLGNVNTTDWVHYYQVNQTVGSVSLKLNGTEGDITLLYGGQVNASGASGYGALTLLRNGSDVSGENDTYVSLNVGYYNYTAQSAGDSNHTSMQISRFVTVNQANQILVLTLDPGASITYGTSLTVTGSGNLSEAKLYRNGTLVTSPYTATLGVGAYNFTWNTSSDGYAGNSTSVLVTVTQAPSRASLIVTPASSITYGTASNFSCSLNISFAPILYLNTTDITSQNNTLMVRAAGVYLVNCTWAGNDNYTGSENSTAYTIDKATSSIALLINGTNGDKTVYNNSLANFTAILDADAFSVTLYTNLSGTMALWDTQNSPLTNYTNLTQYPAGNYSIVANWTGNANYSASSANHTLTLNETLIPINVTTISLNYPDTGIFNVSSNISFAWTPTFYGGSPTNCSLYTNNSGTWGFSSANQSIVLNNTLNSLWFNVTGLNITWGIGCYGGDLMNFSSNRTLNVNNVSAAPGVVNVNLITLNDTAYMNYTPKFEFNVNGSFLSYNCGLYVNNTPMSNTSIINATSGSFVILLNEGVANWNVTCSNESVSNSSGTNTMLVGYLRQVSYAASTRMTSQRRTFYAQGLYWAFYNRGDDYDIMRTSQDGIVWSPEIMWVPGGIPGYLAGISLWANDTYVHMVDGYSVNEPVYYALGKLNANGTITWGEVQNITEFYDWDFNDATIGVNTSGHPWIGVNTGTDSWQGANITTSKYSNGTWETADGFPIGMAPVVSSRDELPIPIPLANGKMYIVYCDIKTSGTQNPCHGRLWNGTDFEPEENASNSTISQVYAGKFSAASSSNSVYLTFMNGSNHVVFNKYTYGQGWGTEELAALEPIARSSAPSISMLGNDAYIFYVTNSSVWYSVKYQNGTWNREILVSNESNESFSRNDTVTTFYKTNSTTNTSLAVMYTAGMFVKYKVLAANESELPLGNSTTLVLNYPDDATTNATTKNITFAFTPTFYGGSMVNATLWTNETGAWVRTAYNSSILLNGSVNIIQHNFSLNGTYLWGVSIADQISENFSANRTLILAEPVPFSYLLTGCMNITTPGMYNLTASISNSNQARCINISVNNVTLDCHGNTIDGDNVNAKTGIWAIRAASEIGNITIKNCVITDYTDESIYFEFVNNTLVTNITSRELYYDGIYLQDCNNAIIENSSFNDGIEGNYGIDVENGRNITIQNVVAKNNNVGGIYFRKVNNSVVDNVTILNSNQYGIISDVHFINNRISNSWIQNTTWSIYLSGDSGNVIFNNFFNNTDNFGWDGINIWNTTNQSGSRIYKASTNYTQIGGNYYTNSSGNGYSDACVPDVNGFCSPLNISTMTACIPGVDCGNNVDYLPLGKPSEFLVSACVNLSAPGGYFLSTNVTGYTKCINVTSSNVTLDCRGFSIDGGDSHWNAFNVWGGPTASYDNVSVKNCVFSNWVSEVIEVSSETVHFTAFNNTIETGNDYAIYYYGRGNSTISFNNITGGSIMVDEVDDIEIVKNVSVLNNTINDFEGTRGIDDESDGLDVVIANNTIFYSGASSVVGILSSSSRDTIISNNHVDLTTTSTAYGIWLENHWNQASGNVSYNNVTLHALANPNTIGIYDEASNSFFFNNVVKNAYVGVYLAGENTSFLSNLISNSNNTGVYMDNYNSVIANNTIENSSSYGIYDNQNVNITINGNQITNATSGIVMYKSADSFIYNNMINGTDATNSNTKGIDLESATNVTSKNNSLSNWYFGVYVAGTSSSGSSFDGLNVSNGYVGIEDYQGKTRFNNVVIINMSSSGIETGAIGSVYTNLTISHIAEGHSSAYGIDIMGSNETFDTASISYVYGVGIVTDDAYTAIKNFRIFNTSGTGVNFQSYGHTIDNITVSNVSDGNGVEVRTSDRQVLSNIYVDNVFGGNYGISFPNNNQDNSVLTNCIVSSVYPFASYDGYGVEIGGTNISVVNCSVNNTTIAFGFDDENITVDASVASNSTKGVQFESGNNTLINSRISDCYYGAYLDYLGNTVDTPVRVYNNLFNNTVNFYSEGVSFGVWNTTKQSGTRIYSSGSLIGGNYYTNSSGDGYSDTCSGDADGFCSPLALNENNTDYLPLGAPFVQPYAAFSITIPGGNFSNSSLTAPGNANPAMNFSYNKTYGGSQFYVNCSYNYSGATFWQDAANPALTFNNLGTQTLTWSITLNSSIPDWVVLFANDTNAIPNNGHSLGTTPIQFSIPVGNSKGLWVYANFTNVVAYGGTVNRTALNHTST